MGDIRVLSPSFSSYGTLTNILGGTVTKHDSGSWKIDLEVIRDSSPSQYLTRKNYLEMDGQKFTIREAVTVRQGERKLVRVAAEHVVHELEDHVVLEDYEFTGTLGDHITELLTHQTGNDFSYSAGPIGSIANVVRTIPISAGTLADGLKRILDNYSAKLRFDNFKVTPVDRAYSVPSNVILEYSIQNNNITKTSSREGVVTKVICRAIIDGEKVVLEYGGKNGYRNGITRFMDLGVLTDVADAETIAQAFLDVYSEPDASYELDFAELKRVSNISTLYPGRNFSVDVGMEVTIKDLALGINETAPVKSYSYSLTNPEALSRITLGNFKYFREPELKMPPEDKVAQERNVMQWAETVMAYVNDVIGGFVRDVDPGLLILTPPSGSRKTLSGVVGVLPNINPEYTGTGYNTPFRVDDPIAEIRRMGFRSINLAYNTIKRYIDDTVGAGGLIVARINSAYASAYGPGTSAPHSPDSGLSVFGDKYGEGTMEYSYANSIVNHLNGTIGNTSSIYLEIGGGNGGAIGAINNLYRMLRSHNIKVSADMPDDSVGKDGDLWFKFDKDEE